MENRKYIIFNVSELDKIDFNEVQETSVDTIRKSVDETLTFVKYDGDVNVSYGVYRLYDRVLTDTEILQNYNIQKGRFGL